MSSPAITVTPDTATTEAIRLMLAHAIKRLPVIDEAGNLLGMVGRAAVLAALQAGGEGTTPLPEVLLALVTRWFAARPDVRAIALVGSFARGAARPDSDLDLVLLVDDPQAYRADLTWVERLPWSEGGAAVAGVRDEDFGALWSRFVTLTVGPPIELGFASPAWARADPLDPGTLRVIRDGCRILYDPDGLLGRLVAAARR